MTENAKPIADFVASSRNTIGEAIEKVDAEFVRARTGYAIGGSASDRPRDCDSNIHRRGSPAFRPNLGCGGDAECCLRIVGRGFATNHRRDCDSGGNLTTRRSYRHRYMFFSRAQRAPHPALRATLSPLSRGEGFRAVPSPRARGAGAAQRRMRGVAFFIALIAIAAAAAPPPDSYVFRDHEVTWMLGKGMPAEALKAVQARYGDEFVWARRSGHTVVSHDSILLDQARAAVARNLGRVEQERRLARAVEAAIRRGVAQPLD